MHERIYESGRPVPVDGERKYSRGFSTKETELFPRLRSAEFNASSLSLFVLVRGRARRSISELDVCTDKSPITHSRRSAPRNRKQFDLGRNQIQGPIIRRQARIALWSRRSRSDDRSELDHEAGGSRLFRFAVFLIDLFRARMTWWMDGNQRGCWSWLFSAELVSVESRVLLHNGSTCRSELKLFSNTWWKWWEHL